MRFTGLLTLFLLHFSFLGHAQSTVEEPAGQSQALSYQLQARGPEGNIIVTTGRIVKAIALARPQSMEIAHIYVNYTPTVKLVTDKNGESSVVVSFHGLKLSGDLAYKGFNISNAIFPSLVTFRLVQPAAAGSNSAARQVLAAVKEAKVNSGDCSVSVSLHQKVSQVPVIEKLAFYHSDDDYERADGQMKLIDRYNTAGWLMQRSENLLDAMQLSHLHTPSAYLAANLEYVVLVDWINAQHFSTFPVIQQNDLYTLDQRMKIDLFRKQLIDEDFTKANVIREEDLTEAARIFADNFANYFDTSQPDIVRATYLSQMAGSRMSEAGFKALKDFADHYAQVQHQNPANWKVLAKVGELVRHAMTVRSSQLAENEQYIEAMGLLKASENFDEQAVQHRSAADSLLISKLSQKLYDAYIDIALKSLDAGIIRVTGDYYDKAVQLRAAYPGMIHPDRSERYLADVLCKTMLMSVDKSLKNNDVASATQVLQQVIHLADSARLKAVYETSRVKLETLTNRPSGYKPWVGEELAVISPSKDRLKGSSRMLADTNKFKSPVADGTRLALLTPAKPVKTRQPEEQPVREDRKVSKTTTSKNRGEVESKLAGQNKNQRHAAADTLKTGKVLNANSFNITEIRQQVGVNVKNIHFKIWSVDTLQLADMLNQTDSLQMLLSQAGDKVFELDVKALRMNYNQMLCDLDKSSYLRELELARALVRTKNFAQATVHLQKLVTRRFTSSCSVDKSAADQLLSSLQGPLLFKKWKIQLDSIARTQEPDVIIEAFEQARNYYRDNMLDQFGLEAPDVMVALKSRKETAFLLKACLQMLNTHRPVYALELLKEIQNSEPKPDKTYSVQKRLGEMLAAGDHTPERNVNEMIGSYQLNEKWFSEMISAYKKQWKKFGK